jgi:cytochrome c oxidase subunit 2
MGLITLLAAILLAAALCAASEPQANSIPSIFEPRSTPADSIRHLSLFVLSITGLIFLVVSSLLTYAILKFRGKSGDRGHEPAQVYGSTQIELAWTVVPVSDPAHPTPAFAKLLSADTDHSFWVPQLAGKTDLIPNRVNETWLDPHETGLFLGQCAQFCGTQHAKMLLRVYVDSPEDFNAWVREQQQPANQDEKEAAGRHVFETTACLNCHSIAGTNGDGRFGPDLTHLMSRRTIAAGAAENTPEDLRLWIQNPDAIKPGSLMPAMKLNDADLDALVRYLETLH